MDHCAVSLSTGVTKVVYVLSCLWDGAYKKSFAANWKRVVVTAGFLSRYLNCSLPYVRRHITVNIKCLSASLNKVIPS